MNHLFIIRHGDYEPKNYRISQAGKQQVEILGKIIKQILNGDSAYILSSTAPRALDSSQILASQLGLPEFEQVPYLWSGNDAPRDSYDYYNSGLDRLMGIVSERMNKASGLVMITHLEVARDFPRHFLKKEFGQDEEIGKIEKGQAVHFDLKQRAYKILPE